MSRLDYLVRDLISLMGGPWRAMADLVRGRVFTMLYRYVQYSDLCRHAAKSCVAVCCGVGNWNWVSQGCGVDPNQRGCSVGKAGRNKKWGREFVCWKFKVFCPLSFFRLSRTSRHLVQKQKLLSMSAVFCGQFLACTESATWRQSATSRCLSALPGRLGRVEFVRGARRRSALARNCRAPTGANQSYADFSKSGVYCPYREGSVLVRISRAVWRREQQDTAGPGVGRS